jgi:hypothetical protein
MGNDNSSSMLIFRTSINGKKDVKRAVSVLSSYSQINRWSVDLEDWEKVLRIECTGISTNEISKALAEIGIYIKELE